MSQPHKQQFKFSCASFVTKAIPAVEIRFDPTVVPRSAPPVKKAAPSILRTPQTGIGKVMMDLIRKLSQKDTQRIFAQPVTEEIAPDYFLVIKEPMDLSTIKSKVQKEEYQALPEFKEDVFLMIRNCMTYNPPQSYYYQEASAIMSFFKRQYKLAKKSLLKDTQQVMETAERAYNQPKHFVSRTITGVPVPVRIKSFSRQPEATQFRIPKSRLDTAPNVCRGIEKLRSVFSDILANEAMRSLSRGELVDDIGVPTQQKEGEIVGSTEAAIPAFEVENFRPLRITALPLDSAEQDQIETIRLLAFYENCIRRWPGRRYEEARRKIRRVVHERISKELLQYNPGESLFDIHINILSHLRMSSSGRPALSGPV